MKLFKFNHNEPNSLFKEFSTQLDDGSYINGHLSSNDGFGKIDLYHYNQIPGIEITVVSVNFNETVLVEDPEEGPNIVVTRFMLKSEIKLKTDDSKAVKTDIVDGCFMYNTKSPFNLIMPKNKDVKFITIRLKLDFLDELKMVTWMPIEEVIFNPKPWSIFETIDLDMENCLKNIFSFQERDAGRMGFTFSESLKLVTLFFIKLVAKRENTIDSTSLTVPTETLLQMKNVLCEDLEHPTSVVELAERFGMSPQKLRLNFKIFFGKSANQLLQQIRYEEAERKLLFSNIAIQNIATLLGFNSAAHFTSEFKKRYSMSPLEYRNSKT